MNPLDAFRASLASDSHTFAQTLEFIAAHYDFQPGAFDNNGVHSAAGQNEGSRRTLGLACLEGFSQLEALQAFGEHYRSVLASPEGSDHANIRALLAGSLDAVHFEQAPPLRRRG